MLLVMILLKYRDEEWPLGGRRRVMLVFIIFIIIYKARRTPCCLNVSQRIGVLSN